MKVLVLSHRQVEELLPMSDCIDVMSDAFAALAGGRVHQPLRMMVRPPEVEGIMVMMPSFIRANSPADAEQSAYGLKAICVFPRNPERGLDAHQGAVLLYGAETGELLAMLNASAITAIRTAAVSGLATRRLARTESRELAIIGSGVQARSHLSAMAAVRPIRRARVASRTPGHAERFAAEMSQYHPFPILPVDSVEAAVRGADLIVTATNASEPVLKREWIAPGAHINAVGAFTPATREIDSATMAAARLFVDRRESTMNEAGDYLIPLREGAIGQEHICAELGELVTDQRPGRTSDDEITLFKSLGIPVEDLAAAQYLYAQAREMDAGTWVDFQ
jgi:ornithine cyclodeaminase/alanine dehydrogenase-like protein (mu-crystallin family)